MTFSPRLRQVQERNAYRIDDKNHTTDICIVWWWIAWVMTAYMLLMHTSFRVTIIELKRLAHGATGHNAGQAAAYFEKPFEEIVQEYWYEQARAGQEALIAGRELLEEILLQEELTVPYEKSTWYVALSSREDVLMHLRRKHLRDAGWMVFDSILLSESVDYEAVPHEYREYITRVKDEYLLDLLQTTDTQYFAAGVSIKWTINSALLCEELALLLHWRYWSRFWIAEDTMVKTIDYRSSTPTLHVINNGIPMERTADDIILCTNWYKNFTIHSNDSELNSWFVWSREWIVWYMIWAFIEPPFSSWCISYFPSVWVDEIVSATDWSVYYYMTVRHFAGRGLVCLWWPEQELVHIQESLDNHTISREHHQSMLSFLQKTWRDCTIKHTDFTWHGLMWYTKSGIREIWPDPKQPHLRYNLWCNGVGICSSVYGAWKIMKQFQWEQFDPSIFDVCH